LARAHTYRLYYIRHKHPAHGVYACVPFLILHWIKFSFSTWNDSQIHLERSQYLLLFMKITLNQGLEFQPHPTMGCFMDFAARIMASSKVAMGSFL
jgi:hypothetical protein